MRTVRMQISIILQVSQETTLSYRSYMVYTFFLTTFFQLGVFKENVTITFTPLLIQIPMFRGLK